MICPYGEISFDGLQIRQMKRCSKYATQELRLRIQGKHDIADMCVIARRNCRIKIKLNQY